MRGEEERVALDGSYCPDGPRNKVNFNVWKTYLLKWMAFVFDMKNGS